MTTPWVRPPNPPGCIETGGGSYDRNDRHRYFLAGILKNLRDTEGVYDHILIAVNELKGDDAVATVLRWCEMGRKVLIDSGIFFLTNEHVRAHPNMTMDEALALPPEEIDGFQRLWDRYLDVVGKVKDVCWGYIELDQGGRENKIRTRAKLEALGFRPMPVYHPLNDGWDYFDQLAKGYDRICFGNVVQAEKPTRIRLVQTAWERHRKYPHLWIHLLGLTPNEWLNAIPIDSADSSAWLRANRWSASDRERADGHAFSAMPLHFRYSLGSDSYGPTGVATSCRREGWRHACMERGWRHHLLTLEGMGFDPIPPPIPPIPPIPAKRTRATPGGTPKTP